METAYLEIILGPMKSGKTTRLIRLYNEFTAANKSVLVVNHALDTRYSNTMMSSHDHSMIPCIFSQDLLSVWNTCYPLPEIILINESQFFEDLVHVVLSMLESNVRVYVCGLNCDFERKKFGTLLDLIPYCDNIVTLKAICCFCGADGIFSLRLSGEKEQTVIGNDNYSPVCRKCYKEKHI